MDVGELEERWKNIERKITTFDKTQALNPDKYIYEESQVKRKLWEELSLFLVSLRETLPEKDARRLAIEVGGHIVVY